LFYFRHALRFGWSRRFHIFYQSIYSTSIIIISTSPVIFVDQSLPCTTTEKEKS